jgi:hypothetical protein
VEKKTQKIIAITDGANSYHPGCFQESRPVFFSEDDIEYVFEHEGGRFPSVDNPEKAIECFRIYEGDESIIGHCCPYCREFFVAAYPG